MTIAEVKKQLESNKLVFGTEKSVQQLKLGKAQKIFLSKNCPEQIRKDIFHYASLSNTEVDILDEENTEIGGICKKPFAISVLALLKQ